MIDKSQPFISVCVPAYNRPETLLRLLRGIDATDAASLEIVIHEDKSPRRAEIRDAVAVYTRESPYVVRYYENEENLGYDKNLRVLIRSAQGEWLVFMGDDDLFIPGALDVMASFLREHPSLGYVLKSHVLVHANGTQEPFRYYPGTRFFDAGTETVAKLFRKSVLISGFTIRRAPLLEFLTDAFDGTLLFQMYLLAEVVRTYPAAYLDVPFTEQREEGNVPFFGSAAAERAHYTPGTITVQNSIRFLEGFGRITRFMDEKYHEGLADAVRRDMSKYFYPSLAIQRDKGAIIFLKYVQRLNQLGFNCTAYYYVYVVLLVVFGKRMCDWMIRTMKKILGRTPNL